MEYRSNTDPCPCRYCVPPKRAIGCHEGCGEYKAWHDDLIEKAADKKKKKAQHSMVDEYNILKMKRFAKGH